MRGDGNVINYFGISPLIPSFQQFQHLLPLFQNDHPDPEKNVFLMMRFREGDQYQTITAVLRQELQKHGLCCLRADDRAYSDDLWSNVCRYMLGCNHGVVAFEEIDEREFNPSVAPELGFMLGHGKRCLILKDSRMRKMPTDIVGKLYKEFDTHAIETSIAGCVDSWVHDLGLAVG